MNQNNQDRAILQAVRRAESELDVKAEFFSDGWAIRLHKGGKVQHIIASQFGINNQASAEIATDKVAASQFMQKSGVACIPHVLLKSHDMKRVDETRLSELVKRCGDIVVKPLAGFAGTDVARFNNAEEAIKFMDRASSDTWCAAPYVEMQAEQRLVVFQNKVHLAYEKFDPVMVSGLNMFNLTQGAKARELDLEKLAPASLQLAADAAQSIGLELAAVDLAINSAGMPQVMEINKNPSLEHFAGFSQQNRQSTVNFYFLVIKTFFA